MEEKKMIIYFVMLRIVLSNDGKNDYLLCDVEYCV